MFCTATGRRRHASPACPHLKGRPFRSVDPDARSTCKTCMVPCMVCDDDAYAVMPSCGHGICRECLEYHATQLQAPHLTCPCRTSLDGYALPASLRRLCIPDNAVSAPVDAWVEALDSRCPSCRRVFVDFDGCAALYCSCGTYFCALCLCECADRASAHAHVLQCYLNPERSYFVSTGAYANTRDRRVTHELICMIKRCTFSEAVSNVRRIFPHLTRWQRMMVGIACVVPAFLLAD